tara:strand:- start:3665 stop:4615 length:951 start_codon:yes stop_codon:yes gene_type:complete
MKIGVFTEGNYQGKVPRDYENIRTDMAWWCTLDATHHYWPNIQRLKNDLYDFGIIIIPKKNKKYLRNFPLVEQMKRVCKKIAVMQESTYYYWQDGEIEDQIWYYNTLMEMDIILCHNDIDKKYYNGITDKRCEIMPTLMITDFVKTSTEKNESAMLGGNFVSIYRGFDDYIVAKSIVNDINAPTTGRMKKSETDLDINHLDWVLWREWMYELSKNKYAVHLGEPGAGTFNLNCSYLGIPCIGHDTFDTQRICHPFTTVKVGEIKKAREIAIKLKNDKEFYEHCSITTKELYEKNYSESIFKEKMLKLIKEVVNENN